MTPIDDMEISVRGLALLRRNDILTVEAVRERWPEGIAALPGMTRRVRKEIGEVLDWAERNPAAPAKCPCCGQAIPVVSADERLGHRANETPNADPNA